MRVEMCDDIRERKHDFDGANGSELLGQQAVESSSLHPPRDEERRSQFPLLVPTAKLCHALRELRLYEVRMVGDIEQKLVLLDRVHEMGAFVADEFSCVIALRRGVVETVDARDAALADRLGSDHPPFLKLIVRLESVEQGRGGAFPFELDEQKLGVGLTFRWII